MPPGIVIVRNERLEPSELRRLVDLFFEDMVKYVVDVGRGLVAVGGEMHADAEQGSSVPRTGAGWRTPTSACSGSPT